MLPEADTLQVFCYDNVCYCIKHKLNIVRVCRTCDVRINCLSAAVLVQSYKFVPNKIRCISKCVRAYGKKNLQIMGEHQLKYRLFTCVVWETNCDSIFLQFFLKQVLFV